LGFIPLNTISGLCFGLAPTLTISYSIMKKTTAKIPSSTTKTATSAKATKQPEEVKTSVKETSSTTPVTKEQPVVAVAAEASPETSTAKVTKQTPEVVKTSVKETSSTTPVTKAPPVVAVTIPAEKTPATPAAKTTKTSAKPKPIKAPVVNAEPVVSVPAITMHERIGLTAGTIWHYLSEHGTTSVVKLVKAIPEEENVIQRSIGWLAAEGKITFAVVDYLEAILLKD